MTLTFGNITTITQGIGFRKGHNTDISDDGKTIIVSGQSNIQIYKYNQSTNVWDHDIIASADINSTINSDIGVNNATMVTIAISGDGNTVAIGYGSIDKVRVYRRDSSGWQLLNTIINEFGTSLSLSYDGNRVAIGDYDVTQKIGAVAVYNYNLPYWDLVNNHKLYGVNLISRYGHSISLSSNGKRLAVSAIAEDNNRGTITVFEDDNNTWSLLQAAIKGELILGQPILLGYIVKLNGLGTKVFGSMNYGSSNPQPGTYEMVHEYDVLTGDKIVIGHKEKYGWNFDINLDGTILVASDYVKGKIFLYVRGANGWVLNDTVTIIISNNHVPGWSVSLSGDGKTVAIGDPEYKSNVLGQGQGDGITYVYNISSLAPAVADVKEINLCYKKLCGVNQKEAPGLARTLNMNVNKYNGSYNRENNTLMMKFN